MALDDVLSRAVREFDVSTDTKFEGSAREDSRNPMVLETESKSYWRAS
jgi:hypothetical protein